ncbi:MBL fold metallo-hydrolase [Sulfurimonas sp. MAG313]|nr:MBL fold metallo-hydrolase [Sulfurimonas sp. MAG313]MDF1880218.1 MBL fold metallo-hydrolase [Sulfurimonas sp. MAG313]
MPKIFICLLFSCTLFASEISVQVLGSGGPEGGERASSSYLIKKDGKAIALIDFGGGAFLRFNQAKAKIEDLQILMFTHLHIDHVVELPALIKAGYFSPRGCMLKIIGPTGNHYFPGLNEYIELQFGKKGAYRYMSDILSSHSESFSLKSYEVKKEKDFNFLGLHIKAVQVNHGIVPAVAYRVEIDDKVIVFSGDTSARSETLTRLSQNADILIAHHAIPEHGYEEARKLHMTPSHIAEIAKKAKVKTLLLSHRMHRTLGLEKEHQALMSHIYKGTILWAEDLMKIKVP